MKDIKLLTNKLIKKYGTNDPFIICQCLNIALLYNDLSPVRGIYQHDLRQKMIHIDISLDIINQRQVCSHELGHAVLHENINTLFWDTHTFLSTNRIEYEADIFAAELLISDADLVQFINYSQNHIASIFGVDERLVEYKVRKIYSK